jgi:hypothetical protein
MKSDFLHYLLLFYCWEIGLGRNFRNNQFPVNQAIRILTIVIIRVNTYGLFYYYSI